MNVFWEDLKWAWKQGGTYNRPSGQRLRWYHLWKRTLANRWRYVKTPAPMPDNMEFLWGNEHWFRYQFNMNMELRKFTEFLQGRRINYFYEGAGTIKILLYNVYTPEASAKYDEMKSKFEQVNVGAQFGTRC